MPKDRLKVYAKSFVGDSGPSKLVSAIEALLGDEGVKRIDIIAVDEKQVERLCAEFEDVKLMGRVRLKAEKREDMSNQAKRLAGLLKAIEDENVLFSELSKQHKATLERLHGEARTLGFAILSGQEELPLITAEKVEA